MLTRTGIEIPYMLDPEVNPPERNGQVQGDGNTYKIFTLNHQIGLLTQDSMI